MGLISALFVNFVFSIGITSAQHYYCGLEEYHATSFAHTLRSPRNNGDQETYPPNARCAWTITVQTGKRVQLSFISFDTYGNPTCDGPNDDFLEIYDAHYEDSQHMIGKYCGSSLPANVVSRHNNLYLVFKTTNRQVVNKNGFILQYKRIDNPVVDKSVCSPLNSIQDNKYIDLETSSVTNSIKSPLYPNKYPSKIECIWIIAALGKKVKLKIKNVKIFNYKTPISCSSAGDDVDSLTVYNGLGTKEPKMKSFCGSSSSSTTLTSYSTYMTIRFKSNLDNYFTGDTAGFEAEYSEVDHIPELELVVGIFFGSIGIMALILICYCIIKKRRYQGYEQRVPVLTMQMTTTATTTNAPQDPVQPQGGYQPLPQAGQAHYPPKGQDIDPPPFQGSYPPPTQGSTPPNQGSNPPTTQGSYPPTTQGSYPPTTQVSNPPNQGSNPPTTQGSSQIPGQEGYPPSSQAGGYPQTAPYPVPSDPPPEYPGPPAYPPQANQPYNPQGGVQQPGNPPPVDNNASAPPPF